MWCAALHYATRISKFGHGAHKVNQNINSAVAFAKKCFFYCLCLCLCLDVGLRDLISCAYQKEEVNVGRLCWNKFERYKFLIVLSQCSAGVRTLSVLPAVAPLLLTAFLLPWCPYYTIASASAFLHFSACWHCWFVVLIEGNAKSLIFNLKKDFAAAVYFSVVPLHPKFLSWGDQAIL